MANIRRPSGPRCPGCATVYQPRVMRDGSLSQTCGRTACVALHNRRKATNFSDRDRRPTPSKAG